MIALDWPGQGASPPDGENAPTSAARYAQILGALIPMLGLTQRPILLGNSIGGAAALSVAIEQPQAIKGLVLCNPGGLAPVNLVVRRAIVAMIWFFSAGARDARWFEPAFAQYYKLVLPGVAFAEHRARIVAAGGESASVMRDAFKSFLKPEADLRLAAKRLNVPCLFAWAKRDRIVAWKASKPAVDLIANAQVQMFEGGHAAFLEDANAFNFAFLNFASACVEPTGAMAKSIPTARKVASADQV